MLIEERIVQSAPDAIIVVDASGRIIRWNAGAERLFGFSESEALTRLLDIIIPEAQRQRHWDGFRRVMSTGVTKYGAQLLRVPAIRKDGSRFSVAFTVGLLKDASGSVEGILAIIRDDSERWETERALRKRVAQAEEATITSDELKKHNGREGASAYVSVNGQVYDVSASPKWKQGHHMGWHSAGADLTEAFSSAPHGKEVFERVKKVGVLQVATAAALTKPPRKVIPAWASMLISFHSHPIAAHFPQAFFIFAPLFLGLFYVTRESGFERTAYYLLGAGFLMAFPAAATGFLHWWYKYGRASKPVFKAKIILSLLLLPASGLVFAFHTTCGALAADSINWLVLISYFAMIPLAVWLGYLGGRIVFGNKAG